MPVVIADKPTIYVDGHILTYAGGDAVADVPLAERWAAVGLGERNKVRQAVERVLAKLTDLSLSFQLISLTKERDAEIHDWEYVVVEIEIHIPEERFEIVTEFLTEYAYSPLQPAEATELLLEFTHV